MSAAELSHIYSDRSLQLTFYYIYFWPFVRTAHTNSQANWFPSGCLEDALIYTVLNTTKQEKKKNQNDMKVLSPDLITSQDSEVGLDYQRQVQWFAHSRDQAITTTKSWSCGKNTIKNNKKPSVLFSTHYFNTPTAEVKKQKLPTCKDILEYLFTTFLRVLSNSLWWGGLFS